MFKIKFCLSFALVLSLFAVRAFALPAQVIILRHAENQPNENTLSARGYERAQALVGFFKTNPIIGAFGAPVVAFAANPSSDGHSIRPIETITPLAKSLNLVINTRFTKVDTSALIHEVLNAPEYDGKTVLICWVRNTLIDLIDGFGVKDGPSEWSEDLFDRALVLNFSPGKPVIFRNIPQHLLPGDSVE